MAQTHLPPLWRERVLALVNANGWNTGVFHPECLRLLAAWTIAEGGKAEWNPLNCTVFLPGATPFNSFTVNGKVIHVWNYVRATDGIAATGMTLANGNYNGILGDLQNGTKKAEQIVADRLGQFKIWGTDPQVILNVLKGV